MIPNLKPQNLSDSMSYIQLETYTYIAFMKNMTTWIFIVDIHYVNEILTSPFKY